MPIFAHIEDESCIDVIERVDEAAYKKLFAAEIVAQWTVIEVPTGTQNGARPNGDGTYTNPDGTIAPEPVP
jgi:hypothetical protein